MSLTNWKITTWLCAANFSKQKMNVNIEDDFGIAHENTKESRLRLLHFKFIYNIYPTNILLNNKTMPLVYRNRLYRTCILSVHWTWTLPETRQTIYFNQLWLALGNKWKGSPFWRAKSRNRGCRDKKGSKQYHTDSQARHFKIQVWQM